MVWPNINNGNSAKMNNILRLRGFVRQADYSFDFPLSFQSLLFSTLVPCAPSFACSREV